MTVEVSLSSMMQLQLQLQDAFDLMGTGLATERGPGEAAIDASEHSSSRVSNDEQAARLRSQAPLPMMSTNRVEIVAAALRSEGLLATAGSVHAEPSGLGGSTAVHDLGLMSLAITSLHVGAAQLRLPTDSLSSNTAAVRRRQDEQRGERENKDDKNEGEADTGQDNANDTEQPEQVESLRTTACARENDSAHIEMEIIEGVVERAIAVQTDDGLFADILDALTRGKQSDLLRQLQRGRRIAAVFPLDLGTPCGYASKGGEESAVKRTLSSAARVYLLWRNADGGKQVLSLAARLSRAHPPCNENGLTLRTYKDRAVSGGWRLRVQPTRSGSRDAAIQVGAAPVLPGTWTAVCLQIPNAPRFWAVLGSQFSLQVVIASAPLQRRNRQRRDRQRRDNP